MRRPCPLCNAHHPSAQVDLKALLVIDNAIGACLG